MNQITNPRAPEAQWPVASTPASSIRTVLIVGGSVAGMSCALQLRKAGVDVHLIDIDQNWRSYGAGLTITGPTLRALRSVGVLDEVLATGATWSGAKLHDQEGNLLTEMSIPPLEDGLPATGGILRPELHRILARRTLRDAVEVDLGISATDMREEDEGMQVWLSDGRQRRYDLVVGADGLYSQTRERLFPDAAKPRFTGQVVFRLLARRPEGFDRSHFFMGPDIKVGFNPVSSTHMYMFLLYADPENPWLTPEQQRQRLYAKMEGFGGFVPQIRKTVLGENAGSINYKPLEIQLLPPPWHRGRVVLIGDAAHGTTPHLASGAGMAIEDGLVVVEELGKGGSIDEALSRFTARRFDRCRHVVENSVKLGELEMNHGSPLEHSRLMSESLQILRAPI
ncbi:MAG: FAD-dependent oxidoreductase [Rudaea sp.]|uniref:FAD-dependent oxidoreductase n=1 Tax=Rudaea sp. TaxID=2136325 RepID=UPI0039E2A16D